MTHLCHRFAPLLHLALLVNRGGKAGGLFLLLIFAPASLEAAPWNAQIGGRSLTETHGPKDLLVGAGQLRIDGRPVRCGRVPALISRHFPDFGAAKRGLIILNPLRMGPLSRGARLVIYYHECAHQFVGGDELAADCWAVQRARRDGLLDRTGLNEACRFVSGLPANRLHPPGHLRCKHMKRCFNDSFNVRAAAERAAVKRGRGFSRPGNQLPAWPKTVPVSKAAK